jgi:HEPN domain-containing protein
MTNTSLAKSCLTKAQKRLKVLSLLLEEESYSDVIRESQETVELALKGMLRSIGVEPPKWHDVGQMLLEYQGRFPSNAGDHVGRLASISGWLRKERELAFYGDIELDAGIELSRLLRVPVDIRRLNGAPISIQYHATRGILLFSRDDEMRYACVERSRQAYWDFEPVARAYLAEVLRG